MKQDSSNCRSNCPINYVLELFGDKWTLLIIRDLLFKNKKTYGEFLKSDEGIATNILADRLKKLEEACIVTKIQDPAHGARALYELTDKGKELLPILLEITAWSAKHDQKTNTPKDFLKMFNADKTAMEQSILAMATQQN